jgi:hypothetical protein
MFTMLPGDLERPAIVADMRLAGLSFRCCSNKKLGRTSMSILRCRHAILAAAIIAVAPCAFA